MKYAEAYNKLLTLAVKEISTSDTSLKKRFGERSKHFYELCEPVVLCCPLSISGCGPGNERCPLTNSIICNSYQYLQSLVPHVRKEFCVFSTTLEYCNIPDTLSSRYQHLYSMERPASLPAPLDAVTGSVQLDADAPKTLRVEN